MKADHDRPPLILFLVLFFGMIAIALGLAALDAHPSRTSAAASQGLQAAGHSGGEGTGSSSASAQTPRR